MKNNFVSILIIAMSLLSFPVLAQPETSAENDTALLGLPGDNLDLFAVLNLFQNSKTIEEFEKSLNEEKTGINNLDLDLDNKVDFIKVVTKQKDQDFTFILQVDVTEKEVQDVAVILVSKSKDEKVTMQIVGDPVLYGKDYVVEPKAPEPSFTANPGYTGTNPIPVSSQSTTGTTTAATTTVIVESTPIVQYVYSPVYVPYYPPYYYHYYPPYYAAFTCMAVGIYRHNNYYHHGGYHGGYHGGGNTVVVHNHNTYNNYNNNSRNTSNTVNNNRSNGNYNNASNRASAGTTASNRASAGTSASNRASTGTSASNRASTGASASTSNRASTGTSASNRTSTGTSASNRSSSSRPSSSSYSSSSSRSSGASRSSYSGGGASRGGGGGRQR
jgi:hypothetical protein